jgi:F-type H+-transporting ATPase subunit epsilon
MASTLRLEIVTPDATAYSEDVEMVTLTGAEGELGVYPNHVPLLTTLRPGELRVLKGGRETFLAVGEGFVEIKGDEGAAEAAVARAHAAMKEDHTAEEIAAIQATLQKALAQLHVKRRRH